MKKTHVFSSGFVAAVAVLGFSLTAEAAEGSVSNATQKARAEAVADPSSSTNAASYSTASPEEAGNFALNMAKEKVKTLLPSFGEGAPEWAKRIEFDARFETLGRDPRFSVLTVQPIWQSQEKENTVFTQLSYQRYTLFGEDRNTVNAGIGYRHIFESSNTMLGANIFFDNEFDYDHRRVGFGAEAKAGPLDGWFNYYLAASDDRNLGAGVTERAISGYDLRAAGQVPYLPWAKLHGTYYHWDKDRAAKDTNGFEFAGEFALHPNLGFEVGHRDDNNNAGYQYFTLRFTLAKDGPSLLGSDSIVSKTAFQPRDMKAETLKKVRRENRILLERSTPAGGGVTVTVVRG